MTHITHNIITANIDPKKTRADVPRANLRITFQRRYEMSAIIIQYSGKINLIIDTVFVVRGRIKRNILIVSIALRK